MHYPVGYNRSLMIVLLVAFITRVDRCSSEDGEIPTSEVATEGSVTTAKTDPATTKTDPATVKTDPATTKTDPATVKTDPATSDTDPAISTTDQPPPADDGKASTFSKCKVELYKSLSTIGRGAGMFLKGFGEAAISVMGAIVGVFNGFLSITATAGDKVASGVNLVNNGARKVVLVRDLTGGAAKLATGMAAMNRVNSEFIIENRVNLIDSLSKGLDNYHPETEKFLIAPTTGEDGADGKSTDTTAAAAVASSTNEDAQATTAESAPVPTPPVKS